MSAVLLETVTPAALAEVVEIPINYALFRHVFIRGALSAGINPSPAVSVFFWNPNESTYYIRGASETYAAGTVSGNVIPNSLDFSVVIPSSSSPTEMAMFEMTIWDVNDETNKSRINALFLSPLDGSSYQSTKIHADMAQSGRISRVSFYVPQGFGSNTLFRVFGYRG